MNTPKNLPRSLAVIAVSLLAVTGCAPESAPVESVSRPAGEVVTINDAWVKSAEEGMSAAFGTLVNSGDDEVTVIAVTSEVSKAAELHETAKNDADEIVMRKKSGGFVIPAGEKLTLEPGVKHIMLMALTSPLTAGSDVSLTLMFADESAYTFSAPVKDYAGANESYEASDEHDSMEN